MNAEERYARQRAVPEVGPEGQARLAAAHVLVVGAGGLGCPVLAYLAAAGVGRLSVIDPDRIEISNLHRQPLYRESDAGRLKVEAARAALQALNPGVTVIAHPERLTPGNSARLVADADVVVDAADSLAVTYVLSDGAQAAGRVLVSASVLGLSGYVGAFCGGAPSYRAVFPEMPLQAGSCAQNGVLGTAVGVIGTLQAHLVLALLLKWQPTPLGRLFSVDFRTLRFGGFGFAGAAEPVEGTLSFIAADAVKANDVVIDLRSLEEAPRSPYPGALRVNVDELERAPPQLPPEARIVLCCRSGLRAWRAARALQGCGHRHLALLALG